MLRSLVALLAVDHDILLRVRVLSFSSLLEEELSGKSWSKAGPFHAAGPRVETCGASVGAWSVVGADAAAPAAAGGVCGASPLLMCEFSFLASSSLANHLLWAADDNLLPLAA